MFLLLLSFNAQAAVFLSPQQVSVLLNSGAVALDARGESDWKRGQLPRSAPLGWMGLRDGLLRVGHLTADSDRLREALQEAGVHQRSAVIVYDAGREGWGEAGRIWWTLDYLGHPEVYILDGGLPAWVAAGLPTSTLSTPLPKGDFQPQPREERRAMLEEVEAAAQECARGPCSTVFWDSREAREYAGATPYGESRGGHIPGAVSLWIGDLTDSEGKLLDIERLRGTLVAAGLPSEKETDQEIVAYCTGGVRSGFAAAVLRELGYSKVANYDGSMWEWSADRSRPLIQP